MRVSRSILALFRLVALAAALALVSSVALTTRGLVRCTTDGSWHVVACCVAASLEDDVTADEPSCCEHVAVTVADLTEHAGVPAALPPPFAAITLFAGARWGTLDDSLALVPAPTGPPPPTTPRRLSLLSTLRS